MKLLHIDSSITGENSVSRLLTRQIVDAWQREQFLERQAQLPGMQD